MEDDRYQKELFEFEEKKRILPKLSDLLPKADFERNVVFTLTLEKAIFLAIALVMVMVVVFALGVESGRGAAPSQQALNIKPAVVQAPAVVEKQPVVPIDLKTDSSKKVVFYNPPAIIVKPAQPVDSSAQNIKDKPYTIMAVTLSSKDNAYRELSKLKKMGFDAQMSRSGKYYRIHVGSYESNTGKEVQSDLKKVRRLYGDARIWLR